MTVSAIRSCRTCEHRVGRGPLANCGLTELLLKTVRGNMLACDMNFSRWEPRSTAWHRLKQWFLGVHEARDGRR